MTHLDEARRKASELSGGTSSEAIRSLVVECLEREKVSGSLIDVGAGRGELLATLDRFGSFRELAGADLFERPTSLPEHVRWHRQDLNEPIVLDRQFDVVVCSETIEHLENPRHVFRMLRDLVRPGGLVVLTMPNQECIRSYAGLLFAGHFTQFLGNCYPAHITALLRLDLVRLCHEVGLATPHFSYTGVGAVPKCPRVSWGQISLGVLRGRLFSDNVAMVSRRIATCP